jgi:hypothetical protein
MSIVDFWVVTPCGLVLVIRVRKVRIASTLTFSRQIKLHFYDLLLDAE